MAAPRELLLHRGAHAFLDAHRVVGVHDPARPVAARLRILVVVDESRDHLEVALRLHVAAHHAEAHDRLAAPGEKPGNDGVEGTLARADLVRMPGLQAESGAAILQADAGAGHHDAGAEAHVIGLDERKHHPFLVGGGEVDGAALLRHARPHDLGAFHVDRFGALREIGVVEELRVRHFHRRRIGHVAPGVGEPELHRLDLQMKTIGGVDRQRGHVEVTQDAQRDERRDSLAIGRHLMKVVAAVLDRDRVDPVGAVRGEILLGHRPVVGTAGERDALGDRAAIEALALGRGDVLERFGLLRTVEALARIGRAVLGQERPAEFRHALEVRRLARPARGGDGRDHEALAGIADRRLEQLLERELAVALR